MKQGLSCSGDDPWGAPQSGSGDLKESVLSHDLGKKNLMRGEGEQRGNEYKNQGGIIIPANIY